jgi:peptidoglycan/LPS O-acetylase OafA/YrhL
MRAIAIGLVVAVHCGLPGFGGGFVGVDIFFVISGYLITQILLREVSQNGDIDFIAFYSRRARRLIPASILMMTATLIVSAMLLAPVEQNIVSATVAYQIVYASNVFFIKHALDYFASSSTANPLLHVWSLAAEEQIYLIWPLFVVFSMRLAKRGVPVAGTIAVIVGLSFAASAYLTWVYPIVAFYSSPSRLWEFGLGALALFVPRLNADVAKVGAAAGLLGIGAAACCFGDWTPFPGFAALVPVLGAAAVLVGGDNNAVPLRRLLEGEAFQYVGRVSYSWYLWHWPILVFAGVLLGDLPLPGRIACGLGSFIVATATYSCVEQPIRSLPLLVKRRVAAIVTAAAISGIGLCGVLLSRVATNAELSDWRYAPIAQARGELVLSDNGCLASFTDDRPKDCSFGDPKADTTVVLFGDSHAAQWFPALNAIVAQRHWRLLTLTKAGCPTPELPTITLSYERVRRPYLECDRWRSAAINIIKRAHPAVVVIANYSKKYVLNSGDNIGIDQWRRALQKMFLEIDAQNTQIILLRDSPDAPFDVPNCIARKGYDPSCTFQRNRALDDQLWNIERDAAQDIPNVSLIDLGEQICQADICTPTRNKLIVFRDSDHLSNAFALSLTSALSLELPFAERDSTEPKGIRDAQGTQIR